MQSIPTVSELIRARLRDKSTPGNRKDPYKLAVVAEGGGQRWVMVGGFGAALEALGIHADFIVGSSGGGLGSVYVTSGVAVGCTCFRYVNTKGFDADGKSRRLIDPRRILRGEPALDIEGLVETVFSHRVPVNWSSLRGGAIPVWLVATQRATGAAVMQPLHGATEAEQKQALKNTARIPWVAHNPRDAEVLWDGSLATTLPVKQAVELGATHLLLLRCRGAGEAKLVPSFAERALMHPALKRQAPDLYTLVRHAPTRYAETMDWLQTARASVPVHNMALPRAPIGPAEMSEARLFRAMAAAYRHVAPSLGLPQPSWPKPWAPEVAAYL